MIIDRKINSGVLGAILTASILIVCGCSNENLLADEDILAEGTPTEITLSIEATRAPATIDPDGTPSAAAADNEKINSWWIAFVDNKGKVAKILHRSDVETGIDTGAAPVEMEKFKCIIPAGVYSIYAFANVDADTLAAATGLKFETGKSISTASIDKAVWSTTLNNFTAPIPMSGLLKNVRVKSTVEETFSIEVVRMVAKMEFLFSNLSDEEVYVNSISVDPVTSSAISLFPRSDGEITYSHLGYSPYSPLENATYSKQTISLSSDNKIAAGAENKIKTIYLQESVSERENDKAFTIGINVRHGNGLTEYEQYNITHDILSYINRNDHIRIPVSLSRYYVEVEALFYPPIGGYPAAISDLDPKGSQIFTFLTEGDFAIVAHITDKVTGSHLPASRYSISIDKDSQNRDKVTDPSGIFVKKPSVASGSPSLPDEIKGTLGNTKGKASVEISVNIYDKPRYETDAKVTATYTRKIYILRD